MKPRGKEIRRLTKTTVRFKNGFYLERAMYKHKTENLDNFYRLFPSAIFGCEAGIENETDAKKITAFEMMLFRKFLRTPCIEKVTNKKKY